MLMMKELQVDRKAVDVNDVKELQVDRKVIYVNDERITSRSQGN